MDDDAFDDDEFGIDLTPLIDVIFMLLIFFVVATSFIKPMLEVSLPEADMAQQVDTQNKEICVVTIDEEGNVFFDNQATPRALIPQKMKDAQGKLIQVFSDEAAPFACILTLMNEAKKNKHESIIFMAKKDA